ncbi:tubulin nucleotide-binding domain-like protein [Russula ochroleuca]|uniref:Tubulin nucleotide-binding domain-like protein n=1 Tax=Russula ochroleuca TaxID=152965 RepID=A0A9P5N0Z8_9AGAM|nr:tubulin nucleotide-binding domain-like protein [Russula ochroleuca]
MKEIIYIQAGNISNHVGTHFWNAQQSYFIYSEDKEILVDHDVSFREGVSPRGEPTYCPRVLQFDRKANFGSLSSAKGIYAEDERDDLPSLPWDGAVDEIHQDPIPDIAYQTQLDQETDEDPALGPPDTERSPAVPPLVASDVRYWSDYNRVYYLPRSIHKLPDLADWEAADGDWQGGKDAFLRYDSDHALMDDSFRLFVEECDTFQGLQLCTDNAFFGSFANSLLTAFRDEFPKQPTLIFAVLSDAVPGELDVDDMRGIRKALNDALCLQGLNELSTMTIPLQSPSSWRPGPWTAELTTDLRSPYDTSGILSAHIETATLSLRLKTREPLYGLCHQLNVYGNTPFAELSGAFPASSVDALTTRVHCFTTNQLKNKGGGSALLYRRDVTRGWPELERRQFDGLSAGSAFSLHSPIEYPLPSSYPSFFRTQELNAKPRHTPRGILTHQRSVPMVSTLASGCTLPHLFTQYADFVGRCVQRKINWEAVGIIDKDEARQLRDDLWTLRDNFGEWPGLASDEDDEGIGEDEEF